MVKRKRPHISLQRFADAKRSTYDRQRRLDKERAMEARQISRYKKLKARLRDPGVVASQFDGGDEPGGITMPSGAPQGGFPNRTQQQRQDSEDDEDKVEAAVPALLQPGISGSGLAGCASQTNKEPTDARFTETPVAERRHAGQAPMKKRNRKPPSQLQRLESKIKAERDATIFAREEAKRAADEHRQKVEVAHQQRKQETDVLRKRTSTGQPVMRYRINKLLAKLQAN